MQAERFELLLEKYLHGALQADERREFKVALAENAVRRTELVQSLVQAAALRTLYKQALTASARLELQSSTEEAVLFKPGARGTRKARPRVTRPVPWIGAAASIAALAALAAGLYLSGVFSSKPIPTEAPEVAAIVESSSGGAERRDRALQSKTQQLKSGDKIYAADTVTTATNGSITLKFADGSTVALKGDTQVTALDGAPRAARRMVLQSGELRATVAPQGENPFVIGAPRADVTVIGTAFTLAHRDAQTRVDVEAGKVRLTRLQDKQSVDVSAGEYAIAASDQSLQARPLYPTEIVLTAAQGRIVGDRWRLVADPEGATGKVLEAPQQQELADAGKAGIQSYVEFTFEAAANKDYYVWVRGKCTAVQRRWLFDMVALDPLNGSFSGSVDYLKFISATAYPFGSFSNQPGYWWVSLHDDKNADIRGVTLRFNQAGRQTLRLFGVETPMRVDTIWLSLTQQRRPEPAQRPN